MSRPCHHLDCRYNLVIIERPKCGRMAEPRELNRCDSCALDVAEYGGETLEEVGARIGLTRERVRQIEKAALKKLKTICEARKQTGGEF